MTAQQYHTLDMKLTNLVQEKTPQNALDNLQNLINVDPAVERYCHGLTHDIGHAAYKKYGFVKALETVNDICGSGYIHGVIESHLLTSSDLTRSLHTICTQGILEAESGNCYHGVGHGLMFYTDNNVPLSVFYCNTYKDVVAKSRCSEGVFMENFNSDVRFHTSKYLRPSDPFYPCKQQDVFYKDACYFYATDYFLSLHPHKYFGAIQWCDSAEPNFITKCTMGVGSRTMKYNVGSPQFVESVCMSANTSEKISTCIDGMVSYYLVQYNSLSRAKLLCEKLKKENQSICNDSVNSRNQMFLN